MAASSSRRNNQHRNAGSYAEDASRLIRENMKCPVCLEVLLPPIYQCETGHNICYLCVDEVTECPLCKSDYGDTRNYFAEELVNSMTFPCKYEEYGCHKTFLGSQLKDHQANCECQPYRCPELACQEVIGVHQMAKHLDKHGFKVMKGDVHQASVEILDDHFERKTEYNPWRISAFGVEFYTVSTRNRDGIWYFWAYGLGVQKDLRKYSYEIVLFSDEKQIMYRGVIQSLRNNPENVMKNGNCLITTDQVIKSIRKSGRIKCQVCFIQGKNWDTARNALYEVKRKAKNAKVKNKKIVKSCPPMPKEKSKKKGQPGSPTFSYSSHLGCQQSFCSQLSPSKSRSRSFALGSAKASPYNILKKELDLNGNKTISKLTSAGKLVKNGKAMSLSSRSVVADDENSFVERVRETLRCPSCNEVIAPPVYQCLIGHNVCHKCRMVRQDCSLCLSPLTDCRNFFAEELLYKTYQRCLYYKNGCKVCLPSAQMKSHEAVCDYAPFECPFNVCRTLLRSDDLLEHMKMHQISTVDKELKNEVFVPRTPPASAVCIIPNILTVDKVAFYPVIVRDSDGNWLFYVITNNYSRYRFELLIKKQSKTLAFQGPVLSLRCKHSQVKLKGNGLVVTERAVKGLRNNDKLNYQVRIKKVESSTGTNDRILSYPESWVLTPRSGDIVSKTELYANKKTSVSPNADSEEEADTLSVRGNNRDRDIIGADNSESDFDDTQSEGRSRTASETSMLTTTQDERESEFETNSVRSPRSRESYCSTDINTMRRHSSEHLRVAQQRSTTSLSSKKGKTVTLQDGQSPDDHATTKRNTVSSTSLSSNFLNGAVASCGVDKNNNPNISRRRRVSLSTDSLTISGALPPIETSMICDECPSEAALNAPVSILKYTENPSQRPDTTTSIHSLKVARDGFDMTSHSSPLIIDPSHMPGQISKKTKRSRSSSKHRVRLSDQVICCGLNDTTEEDVNGNTTCSCASQRNLHVSSSKTSIRTVPSKHVLSVQIRSDDEDKREDNVESSEFQQLQQAVSTSDTTAKELMDDADLLSVKSFNEMTEAVISGSFDVVKSVISLFTSEPKETPETVTQSSEPEPKENIEK